MDQIDPVVSEKKTLKRFSYEKLISPILGLGVIINRNLKEDQLRNIPVKHGTKWPSSF